MRIYKTEESSPEDVALILCVADILRANGVDIDDAGCKKFRAYFK